MKVDVMIIFVMIICSKKYMIITICKNEKIVPVNFYNQQFFVKRKKNIAYTEAKSIKKRKMTTSARYLHHR